MAEFFLKNSHWDPVVRSFRDSGNNTRYGLGNSASNKKVLDDPTFLGFVMFFYSDSFNSPLFNLEENQSNAYTYLKRRGHTLRAEYLKRFIEGLFFINREFPYYWKSIEGLNIAWKKSTDGKAYMGGEDSIINIQTLEAIDLKITHLMDLYRKATYDSKMRRYIVPDNLLWFRVKVFVQEIRRFRTTVDRLQNFSINTPFGTRVTDIGLGSNPFIDENPFYSLINENSSKLDIDLLLCKFKPEESSEMIQLLDLSNPNQAEQKITFQWEVAEENNSFAYDEDILFNAGVQGTGSLFKKKARQLTGNLINQGANRVVREVDNLIARKSLGNVYGFNDTSLQTLTSLNVASGLGLLGDLSQRQPTSTEILGNVFNSSPSNNEKLDSQNVYGENPRSNENLGNSNVFGPIAKPNEDIGEENIYE